MKPSHSSNIPRTGNGIISHHHQSASCSQEPSQPTLFRSVEISFSTAPTGPQTLPSFFGVPITLVVYEWFFLLAQSKQRQNPVSVHSNR